VSDEPNGSDLGRRTLTKGVGLAAGGATLGIGSTATAGAARGFDAKVANWPVRGASKVWERVYPATRSGRSC
jgi:hypothetical protein